MLQPRLLAQGFSPEDILGFYTLRSVPQWAREQKISNAGDLRVKDLVTQELVHNRERLSLPASVLPTYQQWAQWYTQANGKPFGATFELAEVGPLADGPYKTNRIAETISRARDEFLLRQIAALLNAGHNVMVVFGESHLMILQPALEHMLGKPCYIGAALVAAPNHCAT
jgi:hypothetical protein